MADTRSPSKISSKERLPLIEPELRPPSEYLQFIRENDPRIKLRKGTLFFVIGEQDFIDDESESKMYCLSAYVADPPYSIPCRDRDTTSEEDPTAYDLIQILEKENIEEEIVDIVLDPEEKIIIALDSHISCLDFLQWLLRDGWKSEEAVEACRKLKALKDSKYYNTLSRTRRAFIADKKERIQRKRPRSDREARRLAEDKWKKLTESVEIIDIASKYFPDLTDSDKKYFSGMGGFSNLGKYTNTDDLELLFMFLVYREQFLLNKRSLKTKNEDKAILNILRRLDDNPVRPHPVFVCDGQNFTHFYPYEMPEIGEPYPEPIASLDVDSIFDFIQALYENYADIYYKYDTGVEEVANARERFTGKKYNIDKIN